MTETAKVLKAAREVAGLSQRDVTDKLGFTSPQYLSNAERSLTLLSPSLFKSVAKILNVPAEVFIRAHLLDIESQIRKKVRAS